MTRERTQSAARRLPLVIGVLGLLVFASDCRQTAAPTSAADTTLRVGVGALPQQAQQAGLRQFIGSLSIESLAAPNDDGRMRPIILESWATSTDRLSVTLKLRPRVIFHDGTRLTAAIVAQALQKSLAAQMGTAFDDVERIVAADDSTVTVRLRRPSQFVVEALEVSIQKPGAPGVGTGPYIPSPGNAVPAILEANANYYAGLPSVTRLTVTPYPTVRAAWSEMLRGGVDLLNEVNIDALDSLQGASDTRVFSFVRHYQYMIVFSPNAKALRPQEVRRGLSAAIDRDALVREALNGHGIPSLGPVPPQHWTMGAITPPRSQRKDAIGLAGRHIKFTCLVPPDSVYERVALAVKRQLAAVSVDMELIEASQEQIVSALGTGKFETVLGDIVSGPTLFRAYRLWSSRGTALAHKITSPAIDDALDRIGYASSDDEYRGGVSAFEHAVNDDPPALFLAWSERARAVSKRFYVPPPDKNGDILNSIRLWRPAGVAQASRAN